MTRLFENKAIFGAIFAMFAAALVVNAFAGGTIPAFGTNPFAPTGVQRADGPIFPPDPWEKGPDGKLLDDPIFPPDPWEKGPDGKFARLDDPIFPPDPWEKGPDGKFLDDPIFPPDPWEKGPDGKFV